MYHDGELILPYFFLYKHDQEQCFLLVSPRVLS